MIVHRKQSARYETRGHVTNVLMQILPESIPSTWSDHKAFIATLSYSFFLSLSIYIYYGNKDMLYVKSFLLRPSLFLLMKSADEDCDVLSKARKCGGRGWVGGRTYNFHPGDPSLCILQTGFPSLKKLHNSVIKEASVNDWMSTVAMSYHAGC